MSWEFDYARAWQDLALPLYMEQSDELKRLVNNAALLVSDTKQNAQLGIDWPTEELKARFKAVPPAELAALSHIVYAYGHWKPTWTGKAEKADETPNMMPWIDNIEVVRGEEPNNITVVFANTSNSGASWKFVHLADQTLRVHMGKPEMGSDTPRGLSTQVHEGMLRLCFGSANEWVWEDICLATPENAKKLNAVSCSEILHDPLRLRALRAELGTGTRFDEFLDVKASGYYTHEEGTEACHEELEYKYRALVSEDMLYVNGVHCVNWRVTGNPSGPDGHPYTIGRKHLQGDSMYVNTDIGCAHPGCGAPQEAHVCEKVLAFELTRNCTDKEITDKITPLADQMRDDGLDGVMFIDSGKGYEIEQTGTRTGEGGASTPEAAGAEADTPGATAAE